MQSSTISAQRQKSINAGQSFGVGVIMKILKTMDFGTGEEVSATCDRGGDRMPDTISTILLIMAVVTAPFWMMLIS